MGKIIMICMDANPYGWLYQQLELSRPAGGSYHDRSFFMMLAASQAARRVRDRLAGRK